MPKSFSSVRPSRVERYDQSHFLLSFNIEEVNKNDENGFEYDTVLVTEVSKPAIVEALIRQRYSLNDELALLRQRTSKKTEFAEYNDFAEAAKAAADEILANE